VGLRRGGCWHMSAGCSKDVCLMKLGGCAGAAQCFEVVRAQAVNIVCARNCLNCGLKWCRAEVPERWQGMVCCRCSVCVCGIHAGHGGGSRNAVPWVMGGCLALPDVE